MGCSMSCSRKLKTVGLVLIFAAALLTSCGGDSDSNLEMSLRAQLAETQSQLEQAQDLIVELQADLAASESPAETPTPDIVPEGEDKFIDPPDNPLACNPPIAVIDVTTPFVPLIS